MDFYTLLTVFLYLPRKEATQGTEKLPEGLKESITLRPRIKILYTQMRH